MDTAERTARHLPRFLIAKYAPDLRRMEPKNIGVILWTSEGVGARFLGEKEGRISIPRTAHVRSANAYRQWIDYWRGKISRGGIVRRDGAKIGVDDPAFITELLTKSKEQYMLVDGGYFSRTIGKADLDDALGELFDELVAPTTAGPGVDVVHAEAARTLKRSARKAIKNARLDERSDFHDGYDMTCPVQGTTQYFHFDYALHSGRPTAIMTEIPLWKLQQVHSNAYRFTCMQAAYAIPKKKCASLVYATEQDLERDDVQEALRLMETLSTVINVSDPDAAGDRLLSIAL